MGLLGWVDALAMKPSRGSSRPRRAWSSSGVQSSLIKIGQHCKEVYKGIVLCVACTQGSYHLATGWVKQVNGRSIFLTKRRHLRKKIRPKVQFLSEFFQFGVFLPQLFFLATGPASSVTPLTRATKRKKKPRQGHNELKTRFSNGPTKTEPWHGRYARNVSTVLTFNNLMKLWFVFGGL